jgi:hypothetical protein
MSARLVPMPINTGKCPHCKAPISKVVMEGVEVVPGLDFTAPVYNGVSYLCPACHSVLSVSLDPVSLKLDTISGIMERLRKG